MNSPIMWTALVAVVLLALVAGLFALASRMPSLFDAPPMESSHEDEDDTHSAGDSDGSAVTSDRDGHGTPDPQGRGFERG